ncbi:MAG: hypothetical protein N2663_08640 [Chlorobi bacterium]|nr:hypothetical protein [Chlorobiota bacterium]
MQRTLLLFALWAVAALTALSQPVVTLQLPFASRMPSRIAEWRENEALIRALVQNTSGSEIRDAVLSVELLKDGQRIARSRDGHPSQPRFSLQPGESRAFSWREVIAEPAIEYDRVIGQQVLTTGELPEGSYQLCMRVLDSRLRPVSTSACGNFTIQLADPPQLVAPIGGDTVSAIPLLQWTPSSPTAPGVMYRVTVKVRYRGQTPVQAMMSNPVRLQKDVTTTSYQVDFSEQLGPDAADPNYAGHVWQVQAVVNGRPFGRNVGRSQIESFVSNIGNIGNERMAIATDYVDTQSAVQFEIPYDVLYGGQPVTINATLPPDVGDTILYIVRVLLPEFLTYEQLQILLGDQDPLTDTLHLHYDYQAAKAGGALSNPKSAVLFEAKKNGFIGSSQPGTLPTYSKGRLFAVYRVYRDTSYPLRLSGLATLDSSHSGLSLRIRILYENSIIAEVDPVTDSTPKDGTPDRSTHSDLSETKEDIRSMEAIGIASGRGLPLRYENSIVVDLDEVYQSDMRSSGPVSLAGARSMRTESEWALYTIENRRMRTKEGLYVLGRRAKEGFTLSREQDDLRQMLPIYGVLINGNITGPVIDSAVITELSSANYGVNQGNVGQQTKMTVCWLPSQDPKHPWVGVFGQIDGNQLVFSWLGKIPSNGTIRAKVIQIDQQILDDLPTPIR